MAQKPIHERSISELKQTNIKTGRIEPKKKKMSYLEKVRLALVGAKSPVPKWKRKVLTKAEKEINKLESTSITKGAKTQRTADIEAQVPQKGRYAVPSDIEKRKREIARRARQTLLAGRK